MPEATMTQVLIRSMNGPKHGLKPADPAPPRPPLKPIEIDYPHINTLPEYKAAFEKLGHFAARQAEAEARLAILQEQLQQANKKRAQADEDVISKAEALLAGEGRDVNLQAEIQAANKLIDTLRRAHAAQHAVLRQVIDQASRAAGQRYQEDHKKRVKRIMAALDELNAANRYEQDLHQDLIRLGYTGTTLPAMNLLTVEDPKLVCENMTYYWYLNAAAYSQSAEEIASSDRKRRLQAALSE